MNEFSIEKINKVGKAGRIISTIAKICCIVGFIGAMIGAVALILVPKGVITAEITSDAVMTVDANKLGTGINVHAIDNAEGTTFSLEDEEFTIVAKEEADNVYTVTGVGTPEKIDIHNFFVVAIVAAVLVAVYGVNAHFAGKLFKEFETCESPFTEGIVKKMKMLGYSLIPWVFIGGAVDAAKDSILSGKVDITLDINVAMVFAVIIVLFLAYIFEYGAKLQQESDETL